LRGQCAPIYGEPILEDRLLFLDMGVSILLPILSSQSFILSLLFRLIKNKDQFIWKNSK
jgi:hypothetical protein